MTKAAPNKHDPPPKFCHCILPLGNKQGEGKACTLLVQEENEFVMCQLLMCPNERVGSPNITHIVINNASCSEIQTIGDFIVGKWRTSSETAATT